MKKWKLIAVLVCALMGAIVLLGCSGCTAKQVTTEVVTAELALAPLKAQVAALPEGPAKIRMQKMIARIENGAGDAVGWALAVSELEAYFKDLFTRLKAANGVAAVGASTATQPAGP